MNQLYPPPGMPARGIQMHEAGSRTDEVGPAASARSTSRGRSRPQDQQPIAPATHRIDQWQSLARQKFGDHAGGVDEADRMGMTMRSQKRGCAPSGAL